MCEDFPCCGHSEGFCPGYIVVDVYEPYTGVDYENDYYTEAEAAYWDRRRAGVGQ